MSIKHDQLKNKKSAELFHFDLFGLRNRKYKFLSSSSLNSIDFKKVEPVKPLYFFKEINSDIHDKYNAFLFIRDLFIEDSMGFVSANDSFNISFTNKESRMKIQDIIEMEESEWRSKYNRKKDARDWTYNTARLDAIGSNTPDKFTEISYRPFDLRNSLYTGNSRGVYSSPQKKIANHIIGKNNIYLISVRLGRNINFHNYFLTKNITDKNIISSLDNANIFPLYLYPDSDSQLSLDSKVTRTPNLDMKIVAEIAKGLGLKFVPEPFDYAQGPIQSSFAPIDLLDYIYALLHSPTYRETYKEFLKIDFPRVPYPDDVEKFWKLVQLGGELRALHLMESPSLNDYITEYPIGGDNEVEKPRFVEDDNFSKVSNFGKVGSLGRVYINSEQYFDKVPEVAWNFYIGGYQPAQKWLKDRKGRTLEFEDILHYQNIIKALVETERVMGEIDGVNIASYE
jgi:predicted helicase